MKVLTMKGKSNKDFDMAITKSERPLLPEQNDEYRTIAGRDGKRHVSRELGNTQLRVRFFKQTMTVAKWVKDMRDISAWLQSKEEVKIEFDDDPGVYYIGKVTESDVPENYLPAVSFWITLMMHPFKYGEVVDEVLELDGSGNYLLDNTGTYETPYAMTIRPSSNSDTLDIGVNGSHIKLNKRVTTTDVITIDTDAMELRVNGELQVLDVDGYFTMLDSGVNAISSNITGEHSITYQERFL